MKKFSLFFRKNQNHLTLYMHRRLTGSKLVIPRDLINRHIKNIFSKKVDHRSGKNESRSLYKDTGRDQGLREPAEAGEELAETKIKGKR